MDGLPVWVNIVIAIGSLIFGAVGTWITSIYKQKRNEDRDDRKLNDHTGIEQTQQAINIYQDIIKVLREDSIRFEQHLKEMESAHLECCKENVGLKQEIMYLKKELENLKNEFLGI